jgi:DNA-directed RNA polymerase subunit beta'
MRWSVLPIENQYLEDSDPNKFIAKMGAEAVQALLGQLDLDSLSYELRHKANTETSQQRKQEALKRLSVVESLRDANSRIENNPEWMVMSVIPVIPARIASIGTARRWSFCDFRFERSIPSCNYP